MNNYALKYVGIGNKISFFLFLSVLIHFSGPLSAQKYEPVDYVNPLMGTDSKYSLSNGNTYPAIATPWGMNFSAVFRVTSSEPTT